VAAWGNLVNRVLGFAFGRYDGKVPIPGPLDERDAAVLAEVERTLPIVAQAYEEVRLRDALKEALRLTRDLNKYLDDKAPWTVFKTDPVAAGTTVYVAMRAIDSLKLMFAPVLPHTCEQIHQTFGYQEPLFGETSIAEHTESGAPYEVLEYRLNDSERAGVDRFKVSDLKAGTPFLKPTPLFKVLEPLPKPE